MEPSFCSRLTFFTHSRSYSIFSFQQRKISTAKAANQDVADTVPAGFPQVVVTAYHVGKVDGDEEIENIKKHHLLQTVFYYPHV